MNTRKLVVVTAVLLALLLVVTGCSKKEAPSVPAAQQAQQAQPVQPTQPAQPAVEVVIPAGLADGIYFAMEDTFPASGWRETVTLTVEGGKVVDVDWNGVNIAGGVDKKAYDKAGRYNMVKFGAARAEWYQQAADVEAYLVANQKTGTVDEIGSVSIHVDELNNLVAKALAAGPVGRGPLADGAYFAIGDDYPSDWKEWVSLTVINGRIAGANWSALNRTGDEKKAYDKAGKYNMVKFGQARAEWWEQAYDTEQYLIENQKTGSVDEIGSVSIHVDAFDELVEQALANGPVQMGPWADGVYYAIADSYDNGGWKTTATLYVHNGNIVNVYYSGLDKDGRDKQVVASQGGYGMIKASPIKKEWDEQAQAVEAYLIKTQDPSKIKLNNDGSTDEIAGASMTVSDFFTLAQKALAAGPRR
ncbi:MAG: hypothetical protein WC233_03390 [Sphaerochaeta sp.]